MKNLLPHLVLCVLAGLAPACLASPTDETGVDLVEAGREIVTCAGDFCPPFLHTLTLHKKTKMATIQWDDLAMIEVEQRILRNGVLIAVVGANVELLSDGPLGRGEYVYQVGAVAADGRIAWSDKAKLTVR